MSKHCLVAVTCLLTITAVAAANNVFVLPDNAPSRTVTVFSAEPFVPAGSFQGPRGPGIDTLASPDSPVTYWTIGDASTDTVVAVDPASSIVYRSSSFQSNGRAAVVTSDGTRLLVVGGTLRVFDTIGMDDITPNPPLLVGSDPSDVAVGVDPVYAYVLSPGSQRLYKIDLGSEVVESSIVIPGQPAGVTMGPDQLLYVSTSNQILIIDPVSMAVRNAVGVNGNPAKVYFTPDGKSGMAVNRTPITNATLWVFDPRTRMVTSTVPTLYSGLTPITMQDKILMAGNDRGFLTSATTRALYELKLNPAVNVVLYNIAGVGTPAGVISAAISNELPQARHLFYVTSSAVTKVDLASNALVGTPLSISGGVSRLAHARQPSDDTPVSIIKYQDQQTIVAGGTFQTIVVRALDQQGRPVFGAPVSFETSNPDVSIDEASDATSIDGLARATVNPGDYTGQVTITVTVGESLTTDFSLVVSGSSGGGGGGGATGLAIFSGNGQLVPSQFLIQEPLIVIVRSANGDPVAGSQVTFRIIEGQGTLSGATTPNTDAEGKAQITFISPFVPFGQSWVQTKVRAARGNESVDFLITTFPLTNAQGVAVPPPNVELITPPLNNRFITGPSGETLEGGITARVVAGFGVTQGQPIPGIKITTTTELSSTSGPTAWCAGGEPLSGADGIATCDVVLGGMGTAPLKTAVGAYRILPQINLTVTPAAPASIAVISGNNQSGAPGAVLQMQLVAEVRGAAGGPLSGVQVQWEVVDPTKATLRDSVNVSDSAGRVSTRVALGNTPGPVQVRVRTGAASATFNATVVAQATSLAKISGDNQVAVVGQPFASALVVELKDATNAAVVNAAVNFAVTSGSATLSSSSANTDTTGRASVSVTAGSTAGAIVVTASHGSLTPATFSLTARLPGPALTASSFTNGASGAAGVVPGSVVRIVGAGLAPGVRNCVVPDPMVGSLPLVLAQVTVQFGPDSAALYAPIYHVCNQGGAEWVTVQAPFDVPVGTYQATVRVSGGSTVVQNVQVLPVQPGLFEAVAANGVRHGVVVRPNGSFVSPDNPAGRGETLTLYATGLGPVDPPAGTNMAGVPGQTVRGRVIVGVNNQGVRVIRSEYAINMIGIYAVQFEVPTDMAVGAAVPLSLAVQVSDTQLVFSNGSTIAVQ